jgi:Uma2 family endonuclease
MSTATAPIPAQRKARANGRLPVCVNGEVKIPASVRDHASYRRWARSDDFPERGRFAFLDGTIWVDMTMEQIFTHNAVKTEITRALATIVQQEQLGYLFSDGTLLSHVGAGLSTEPDACYVSYAAVKTKRVRWIKGATTGYVEVEGTPDLALEVVSDSSVEKDTVILRELYWRAGVPEYWLVDARASPARLEILRYQPRGYVLARKRPEGWLKSAVFGRSFRLLQATDPLGHPQFTLEIRD